MQLYPHEIRDTHKPKKPITVAPPPMDASYEAIKQMRNYLEERGLNYDLARTNQWYPSRKAQSAYQDQVLRMVMPATSSLNRQHQYWQARALDNTTSLRYSSPQGSRLDALIYCYPQKYQEKQQVGIVEGPMDALALAGEGLVGVAVMGAYPSPEAIQALIAYLTLHRFCAIFLFSDSDKVEAMMALQKVLSAKSLTSTIKTCYPYNDFASIPKQKRSVYIGGKR